MRLARLLRRLYVASGLRERLPHRTKTRFRRAWVRVARAAGYPVSSPLLPRPPLHRRRRRMRLSHVLLACDLNAAYLDFWPSSRRAWRELVGLDPVLLLVAREEDVPDALRTDPDVVRFEPLEGLHATYQAQCVRLLWPALVATGGAVLIADIDLYPLDRRYFHDAVEPLDERFFVSWRDERIPTGEVDINYNAAAPATWGEVFGVSDVDDVRARLREWAPPEYDGRRGWEGWFTDQRTLHARLAAWPEAPARRWSFDDEFLGFRRLDRLELEREGGLTDAHREGLRARAYDDFSCLVPYRDHRGVNDEVLALATEAARG